MVPDVGPAIRPPRNDPAEQRVRGVQLHDRAARHHRNRVGGARHHQANQPHPRIRRDAEQRKRHAPGRRATQHHQARTGQPGERPGEDRRDDTADGDRRQEKPEGARVVPESFGIDQGKQADRHRQHGAGQVGEQRAAHRRISHQEAQTVQHTAQAWAGRLTPRPHRRQPERSVERHGKGDRVDQVAAASAQPPKDQPAQRRPEQHGRLEDDPVQRQPSRHLSLGQQAWDEGSRRRAAAGDEAGLHREQQQHPEHRQMPGKSLHREQN